MFYICGVLRFRGNWGLRALIAITALRVPAAQGRETPPGRGTTGANLRSPLCPTAACRGRGGLSNQHSREQRHVWNEETEGKHKTDHP